MGVTTALLTVEEYAQLPEELVRANCIEILADYVRQNPTWKLFSDDAPQLAFEAVSSESAAFLERKINVYLASGFRVIWIAYPP